MLSPGPVKVAINASKIGRPAPGSFSMLNYWFTPDDVGDGDMSHRSSDVQVLNFLVVSTVRPEYHD